MTFQAAPYDTMSVERFDDELVDYFSTCTMHCPRNVMHNTFGGSPQKHERSSCSLDYLDDVCRVPFNWQRVI